MKDKDLVWCDYCGTSICKPSEVPKYANESITHFCNKKCLEYCFEEFPETFQDCPDEVPAKWRN